MEVAITIAGLLVKYGPDVAESVQRIFATGKEPTQADWDAIFAKARKSYDDYILDAEKRLASGGGR